MEAGRMKNVRLGCDISQSGRLGSALLGEKGRGEWRNEGIGERRRVR